MMFLKVVPSLLMTLAFMAGVDYVLFHVPVPGWIPVLLIVIQALYVTMTYGFVLMASLIPARRGVN